MKDLTLLEALAIAYSGWSTNDEKDLFYKADEIIRNEAKRLDLINKKNLIEIELEQFKNK